MTQLLRERTSLANWLLLFLKFENSVYFSELLGDVDFYLYVKFIAPALMIGRFQEFDENMYSSAMGDNLGLRRTKGLCVHFLF